MRRVLSSAALALALVAGCGTKVAIGTSGTGSRGSGGSGGVAVSSSVSGGSGGSGGVAVSSSVAGGSGGSPATGCSSPNGCGTSGWCAWVPPGTCGSWDPGVGLCEPIPSGCPADCPGACGCDGQYYCNTCLANQAGTDVTSGSCTLPDAGPGVVEYFAWELATNLPRYAIVKIAPTAGVCTVLVLAQSAGPGFGIMTAPSWSVEQASIQADVAACMQWQMGSAFPMPSGQAPMPSGGSGVIAQSPAGSPCTVSIHAKLLFASSPPWVPPIDALDADNVAIKGAGCGG